MVETDENADEKQNLGLPSTSASHSDCSSADRKLVYVLRVFFFLFFSLMFFASVWIRGK